MLKKVILTCLFLLLVFIDYSYQNTASCESLPKPSSQSIQKMEVPAAVLGTGCKRNQSYYVNQAQLNQFSNKFGTKIVALKNDKFINTTDNKVQINYMEAATTEGAEKLYLNMVNLVGYANVVMLKNKVVIEVISGQVQYKQAAIKYIQPQKLHKNY